MRALVFALLAAGSVGLGACSDPIADAGVAEEAASAGSFAERVRELDWLPRYVGALDGVYARLALAAANGQHSRFNFDTQLKMLQTLQEVLGGRGGAARELDEAGTAGLEHAMLAVLFDPARATAFFDRLRGLVKGRQDALIDTAPLLSDRMVAVSTFTGTDYQERRQALPTSESLQWALGGLTVSVVESPFGQQLLVGDPDRFVRLQHQVLFEVLTAIRHARDSVAGVRSDVARVDQLAPLLLGGDAADLDAAAVWPIGVPPRGDLSEPLGRSAGWLAGSVVGGKIYGYLAIRTATDAVEASLAALERAGARTAGPRTFAAWLADQSHLTVTQTFVSSYDRWLELLGGYLSELAAKLARGA